MGTLIEDATLTRQSYGLAMAQGKFGGPRGIWLECMDCDESQKIVGSNSEEWAAVPTPEAAKVFRRHGWTGDGPTMRHPLCPKCARKVSGWAAA